MGDNRIRWMKVPSVSGRYPLCAARQHGTSPVNCHDPYPGPTFRAGPFQILSWPITPWCGQALRSHDNSFPYTVTWFMSLTWYNVTQLVLCHPPKSYPSPGVMSLKWGMSIIWCIALRLFYAQCFLRPLSCMVFVTCLSCACPDIVLHDGCCNHGNMI